MPQILPGGKAFLFTAENSTVGFDEARIDVVTLAEYRKKTLQHGGIYGRYRLRSAGKGYFIFVNPLKSWIAVFLTGIVRPTVKARPGGSEPKGGSCRGRWCSWPYPT